MIQENDYNIVKPVENMPNVGAMAPIDRHTEKKRRQQGRQNSRRTATAQQNIPDQTSGLDDNQTGRDSIDYRA